MTPEAFIRKWQDAQTKERSAAQEHFIDLCRLLDEPTPNEADPAGEWYCFERGARKTGGGDPLRPRSGQGWADVWKKGCFGWEYKGKGKDLSQALKQLQLYALALESPPLLIVSDIETIVIHTAFTNAVVETWVLALDDLADPDQRRRLKWAFSEPERLRPGQTAQELTERAAARFASLAKTLCDRGHEPHRVAHFLNKLLFCLFAEDVGLLPRQLFTRLLENGVKSPDYLGPLLQGLFKAMATGGPFGVEVIDRFNGGLFDGDDTLPLERAEVQALLDVSRLDWSAIEPAIFGTLFERGLDPAKRSQLGAHYTDRDSILRIIDPVIREPLLAEWEAVLAEIEKDRSKTRKKAQDAYAGFLERLRDFRVLDPACGSGNFLYLALQTLKDLEHRVILEAEAQGLPRQFPSVGPEAVRGIELNPYAAELARVTVWIGEIQWMLKHGYSLNKNPILRPLDTIEQRDAIIEIIQGADGNGVEENGHAMQGEPYHAEEPSWPPADVIIGNPPFLGGSKLLRELGESYVSRLRGLYQGRVPGGADLVCYWFEKARAHIEQGKARRAGLVATNSLRGGANRKVLERILDTAIIPNGNGEHHGDGKLRLVPRGDGRGGAGHATGLAGAGSAPGSQDQRHQIRPGQVDSRDVAGPGGTGGRAGETAVTLAIFNAWSDQPWINEGAAVRVSLVCFGQPPSPPAPLPAASVAALATVRPPAGEGSEVSPSPGGRGVGVRGAWLDGQPVAGIHADLTGRPLGQDGGGVDLTKAKPLADNSGICFMGASKKGPFDIPGDLARAWLKRPNPHGRPNGEVLRPLWNGLDLTRRPRDQWVVDFGTGMSEREAALYEAPFEYVLKHVKSEREKNNRESYRKFWWRHAEPRPGMRAALTGLPRYIATPEVAKYRLFVWMRSAILPDQKLYAVARADDVIFGILHSRFHELWSLGVCTWHGAGNDPRYTPTTTFETFPFPEGVLTDSDPDTRYPAIAQAARRLDELRENWLNPPDWVDWVITPEEDKAGFPKRPVAKPGHQAELKTRTLTNLYNQRPAWLDQAHQTLDAAVAAAYGWSDYTPALPDEEILRRLLALNFQRRGLE
jgi:hypothetical protein